MKIHDVKITKGADLDELSGLVGDFRIWYKFPKNINPQISADPFVAASLIPSMFLGEDIEIDSDVRVSPMLIKNTEVIQDVFLKWSPYFNKPFKRISIIGGLRKAADTGTDARVSFFSGGVDGTHTFLRHQDEIDYLLFAKGIDMQLSNSDNFEFALKKNTEYLENNQKKIYPIETNVRYYGHEFGLSWNICFGGGLSSIALAGAFKRCYIASGISYADLYPHGSSFMTDHLWSNEYTEIVHDGADCSRIEKIKYLASDEEALNILRVCWHDRGYNCGECEKCLRTMASLRALGLQTPTFPDVTDEIVRNRIRKLRIYEEYVNAYLYENIAEAEKRNDKVLLKALIKIKRRGDRSHLLHLLDDYLLAGGLSKIKKRLRNR